MGDAEIDQSVDGAEGADTNTEVAEAPAEWDGSIEALVEQPWVPEPARAHIAKHLEDYTSTKDQTRFLEQMFAADDRTAELAKALSAKDTELASLKQALEAAGKERDDYKGKATTYEQQAAQDRADREYDRLKAAYGDIHADCRPDPNDPENFTGAWPTFVDLMDKGYDEPTAARLARAMLDGAPGTGAASGEAATVATPAAPPARRQVVIPPSIQAASRGGNSPTNVVNAAEANENLEQRIKRLENEARAKGE